MSRCDGRAFAATGVACRPTSWPTAVGLAQERLSRREWGLRAQRANAAPGSGEAGEQPLDMLELSVA